MFNILFSLKTTFMQFVKLHKWLHTSLLDDYPADREACS
jgi:hypothetical protein